MIFNQQEGGYITRTSYQCKYTANCHYWTYHSVEGCALMSEFKLQASRRNMVSGRICSSSEEDRYGLKPWIARSSHPHFPSCNDFLMIGVLCWNSVEDTFSLSPICDGWNIYNVVLDEICGIYSNDTSAGAQCGGFLITRDPFGDWAIFATWLKWIFNTSGLLI